MPNRKKIILTIIFLAFIPLIAHAQVVDDNWKNFGDSINNSFFFVLDKIIRIQSFFIREAYKVGRVALLIALLSTGLNYALTGTGFKENIIKIMKATLFFLIITSVYPKIIGWITGYAYNLAFNSVGKDIEKYYTTKTVTMGKDIIQYTGTKVQSDGTGAFSDNGTYNTDTFKIISNLTTSFTTNDPDLTKVFSDIKQIRTVTVNDTTLAYTVFAPASVVKILLITAGNAFNFSDKSKIFLPNVSEFSKVLKGIICGFFLLLTGFFALVEYLVCTLEFFLVASVGILLLPLSIWEGSKFLSEKFIGAIVGFFMKLLFCNIAIFLLFYGYVSMFRVISLQSFKGSVDQIAFILFSSLLFFFICKSAPVVAQSLLTGTPSLNAAGAIGAVSGAVAAAATTAGIIGAPARMASGGVGSLITAGNAKQSAMQDVAAAGGSAQQIKQAGNKAFFNSLGHDAGNAAFSFVNNPARSLSRSLFGNSDNNVSLDQMKAQGGSRGNNSASKYKAKNGL